MWFRVFILELKLRNAAFAQLDDQKGESKVFENVLFVHTVNPYSKNNLIETVLFKRCMQ